VHEAVEVGVLFVDVVGGAVLPVPPLRTVEDLHPDYPEDVEEEREQQEETHDYRHYLQEG
jgi:hypothetical protein